MDLVNNNASISTLTNVPHQCNMLIGVTRGWGGAYGTLLSVPFFYKTKMAVKIIS